MTSPTYPIKTETTMPASAAKNACDLLDADHLAVKHLFVEYARMAHAPAELGADRRALALKICEELTVHAQVEEDIFYPALQQAVPGTADVVAEARAEHAEAKQLIASIQAGDADGDALDALVAALARTIEDHVKEERDELFPKARTAAGLDLHDLADKIRDRQQALAPG